MQKQSEIIHLRSETGLTTLSTGVILREQNKVDVLKHLAALLNRLSRLYQVPGWTPEHAADLAEWVYDNYNCEELKTVTDVLSNPPPTQQTNWRLTPDTITAWMLPALEREAIAREKEVLTLKENFKDPLPGVDYEAFKKRVEVEGLPEPPKPLTWNDDPEYSRVKSEFMRKKVMENKPPEP